MRKLATVCAAFSAAIFAANFLLPGSVLLPAAAFLAAAGAALLALRRRWLRGVILAAFGLAAGLLCFAVHARCTTLPARRLDGETKPFTAVVLAYPRQYEEYASVELRLRVDGAPPLQTVLYDRTDSLGGLEPGDRITGTASLHAADLRFGKSYDRYNARNVFLTASLRELTRRERGGFSVSAAAVRLNRALADRIGLLFPEDTAAYFRALLLGDKSELYQDDALYLAMSRAGFLHIVAVSGMHVAALVAFLQLLLGTGRRSSLLCLLLVWCFVLVTGASPSALRAAFMQSTLLLAPLLRRENDPATSLLSALALLLALNPCAAASVSLQLSFAAMAGLMITSDRLFPAGEERHAAGVRGALLRYLRATAASSLGVLIFTVPLIALHFGMVPLLSPLGNLLALWTVPLCFGGGFLACALSMLSLPAGVALAWLLAWPARLLLMVARGVSSLPFAAVYLQNRLNLLWLVLCYLLLPAALASRWPRKRKLLAPAAFAAAGLLAVLLAARLYYDSGSGFVTALDVGQGQSVAVFAGDRTLLIDCGAINSLDSAGDTAGGYLRGCGRKRVDVLLLTHLHADHANGVTRLLEYLPVDLILLPTDPDDPDGLLSPILNSAERHGTRVLFLAEDLELSLDALRLRAFAPGTSGDINERCLTAAVTLGDYDLLVTGDLDKAAERELLERHDLQGMELLIAGHHGSRYSCSGELLSAIGADTAVVSVGENSFGHPTHETLERLAAYGYTVYRTDLNGNVEFRIR